jgi:preprotein translocase subunit SecE
LRVRVLPGLYKATPSYGRRFGRRITKEFDLAERAKKQNAIRRYLNETTGELKKVSWPTWPEARQLTILVLIVMVVIGVFLGLVDYGANNLLNLALGI